MSLHESARVWVKLSRNRGRGGKKRGRRLVAQLRAGQAAEAEALPALTWGGSGWRAPAPGPALSLQAEGAPRHRLGVATRIVGAPLRAHDSRRWQQQPHLSVSLAYLRDIFAWLERTQIRFYRLSSALAPYATHPDLPGFQRQIDECSTELAELGDMARALQLRLTMHPGRWVRLESEDETLAARAQQELTHAARLLDAMGVGGEGVLVVHAGLGTRSPPGGDAAHSGGTETRGAAARWGPAQLAALGRFARRVEALPPAARRRIAVENDDQPTGVALDGCLWLHRRTGVPVVLDVLHHKCHNPAGLALGEALQLALASWPAGQRPKLHLSSPRTELRLLRRAGGTVVAAPLANQHSDFINPFEAIELLQAAQGLPAFDILLEAKAHDLALLRLRAQLAYFAPALAATVG